MVKEAIGIAETLILAQQKACEALGVAEQDVSFEVLQMPARKVLGFFGGKLAKVKAVFKISPAEAAVNYLREVLSAYGVKDFSLDYQESDKGIEIHIVGGNAKIAIGYRGDTLDAIQYLVGLVANAVSDSYYQVVINISDYRERREKTLVTLAENLAARVLRLKTSIELEPMTPYERKVIHMTIEKINGVKSWSEGEGLLRHLIVALEPAEESVEK